VLCLTGLIFTLLNRLFTSQFLFLLESSFSVVTSVSLLPPCCAGVFAGTLITHNFPLSFLPGIFCLCPWSTKSLVRFGYSFFFFCVFMQFITCSASVLLCCSGLSHCRLSKSIPLTNQRYVLKGICCFFILMSVPLCFVYVFLSCDFFKNILAFRWSKLLQFYCQIHLLSCGQYIFVL